MLKINKKDRKKIFKIVGLAFLIVAVISGVILVKSNQDIREIAAGKDQCYQYGGTCIQGTLCKPSNKKKKTWDCNVRGLSCCYENTGQVEYNAEFWKKYIEEHSCKTNKDCEKEQVCMFKRFCI